MEEEPSCQYAIPAEVSCRCVREGVCLYVYMYEYVCVCVVAL